MRMMREEAVNTAADEKEELFGLYSDYMNEIWSFTRGEGEEKLREWFECIYEKKDTFFYKIYEDENSNDMIGFLVVQDLDEKHRKETGAEKYICEAYIKPELRHHGIMKKLIQDRYIKENISVAMHISKYNISAKKFWSDVFMRNRYSYEHIREKDQTNQKGNCEFIRFTKVS